MVRTVVGDCEVYRNYFLASFMNVETENVVELEMFEGQELDRLRLHRILRAHRVVTFNGNNYDAVMMTMAINGATCAELKWMSDAIIEQGLKPWQMDFPILRFDHIDLIEIAPGIASLKIYGGRLHAPKMQDLPIEPSALITPEQRPLLRTYCRNDLGTTKLLFEHLKPQIELREKMGQLQGIDLRSKSDAQIAEAVIRRQVEKRTGDKLAPVPSMAGSRFSYKPPPFVQFTTEPLQKVLDIVRKATFTVNDKGVVVMPQEIESLKIAIGSSVYRMGIGGLHSSEKSVAYLADNSFAIEDDDVTSYYPAIIINCGLAPKSISKDFGVVFKEIVSNRVKAKRSGDKTTSDSLKIVVNSSYGKFGSPYSRLYSPTLLIQTTLTGQLALLMQIEMMEQAGITVISANTDGVVTYFPRRLAEVKQEVILTWEIMTGFETENTEYRAVYSRDVNNYIAIKPDGKAKPKGAYAPPGLQKNPTNEICIEAVTAFLTEGLDVETFIRNCIDIRKFVTVRTVNGGAICNVKYRRVDDWVKVEDRVWARQKWLDDRVKTRVKRVSRPLPVDEMYDGEYLGKAIRWYYAKGVTGSLHYKTNGNTVPRSEGAKPLMELPEVFPDDVDIDWYVAECRSILKDIGYDT